MFSAVLLLIGVFSGNFLNGAQNQPASASPDFSGLWELGYDGRSVPPATLTVKAQTRDPKEIVTHDLNAMRWCILVGLPQLMDPGEPLDIVQDSKQLLITGDRAPGQARHIYLNAKHPDMDTFDPQVVGHSTAKWQGDTLVVDTIGFSDKGMLAIPGGGWRTETSHLVERYRLLDGGRLLSITFTWEDPAVFEKPHTYEFRYNRLPEGTSAHTYRCDASDRSRADFILRALPGSNH